MKLSLGLVLGAALITACAADSTNDTATGSGEIIAHPVSIVGAYRLKAENPVGGPSIRGIVFETGGAFFADVDTGAECIIAPCPTAARLEGTYSVIPSPTSASFPLVLTPKAGTEASDLYGTYRYAVLPDGSVRLSKGDNWINTVEKTRSYCSAAADCEGQSLIVPACIGYSTCGAENACGFTCGVLPPETTIWPADRQKLVAENKGGGFIAPPPAGSTCAYGTEKFTLDIASRTLSWDRCSVTVGASVLHTVSGQRVLSAGEVAKVDTAMNTVKLTKSAACGADKPLFTIDVTSASQGSKTYADSFYACSGGGRTYVDNIDEVFDALDLLAH